MATVIQSLEVQGSRSEIEELVDWLNNGQVIQTVEYDFVEVHVADKRLHMAIRIRPWGDAAYLDPELVAYIAHLA